MVNAQITSVSGVVFLHGCCCDWHSSPTVCRYLAAVAGIGRFLYASHDGQLLHLTLLAFRIWSFLCS